MRPLRHRVPSRTQRLRSLDVGGAAAINISVTGTGAVVTAFAIVVGISAPQTTAPDIATPADASITTASATADWPDTRSSVSYPPESGVTLDTSEVCADWAFRGKQRTQGRSSTQRGSHCWLPWMDSCWASQTGMPMATLLRVLLPGCSDGRSRMESIRPLLGSIDPAGEIRPALRKSCTYVSVVDAINTRVLESFTYCPSRLEADSISSGKS